MPFSKSPTIKHEKGNSSRHHKEVGSGARPSKSKVPIMTSAPKEPYKLSRGTKSALK